jgi:AbrB family looped-hinge helix DNA binding protein
MVDSGNMVEVGRYYKDGKGAGRVYIPKKLAEKLCFKSGERIIIKVTQSCIEIRKLDEVTT